jgi:hypothetical protein
MPPKGATKNANPSTGEPPLKRSRLTDSLSRPPEKKKPPAPTTSPPSLGNHSPTKRPKSKSAVGVQPFHSDSDDEEESSQEELSSSPPEPSKVQVGKLRQQRWMIIVGMIKHVQEVNQQLMETNERLMEENKHFRNDAVVLHDALENMRMSASNVAEWERLKPLCNVPDNIVTDVVGEVFRKFKFASRTVSTVSFLCPMVLHMQVISIELTSIVYRG